MKQNKNQALVQKKKSEINKQQEICMPNKKEKMFI